jgi:DNA mismatch repair protein MSH6
MLNLPSRSTQAFTAVQRGLTKLAGLAESFKSTSTSALLRSAPDLEPHLEHIRSLFTYDKETGDVLPADGVDEAYEDVQAEIDRLERQLDDLLREHAKELGCRDLTYWHSAQGQKEIYQIQVPVKYKAPKSWTKTGGVKAFNRYASPETVPVIRELQEARETRTQAVRAFIRRLLAEFDNDRDTWLLAVKIVGELDCLGSLAVASQELDEP